MVRVYKRKYFNLYSDDSGEFIIHNTKKDFKDGHTHIRNYNTAKFLIDLALHKTVPKKKLNRYLYQSLIRITDDDSYRKKINIEKSKVRR